LATSKIVAGQTIPVEFIFYKHLLPGKFFVTLSVHELIGDVSLPVALYQNCLSFDVPGNVDSPMTGMVDLRMEARVSLTDASVR
jgi:hypothetical protein